MNKGPGRFRFGATAVALTLVFAFVLTGCGGGSTGAGGESAGGSGTSQATTSDGGSEAEAKPGGVLTLADFDDRGRCMGGERVVAPSDCRRERDPYANYPDTP